MLWFKNNILKEKKTQNNSGTEGLTSPSIQPLETKALKQGFPPQKKLYR